MVLGGGGGVGLPEPLTPVITTSWFRGKSTINILPVVRPGHRGQ